MILKGSHFSKSNKETSLLRISLKTRGLTTLKVCKAGSAATKFQKGPVKHSPVYHLKFSAKIVKLIPGWCYTGRVDPDGGTDQLPLCLYGKTMLLTHINLPNRVHVGSHANVPMLDTVIVKLYQKERGLIGGRVHVREEILQDVDQLRTSRYAWLRMQAMHWGLNFAEYEGRSFWNVVDCQLAYLRSQSTRYRYAFFLLVLQFDLERIDGTKTFEELKETTDFSLPTETQIQDTIDELNVTFGDEVQPEEEAYQSLSEEET
ncbi:hypothetical protein DFH28DRAFT_926909 [Melampsora americana]|nr:hypothetical protein DFH28DRAFT_926909 [Melampsora americana]